MLEFVSFKLFAEMMSKLMGEFNGRCGTDCHHGGICSNRGACIGKVIISHEICPNTRMEEIHPSTLEHPSTFVESYMTKENGVRVRRVKCGADQIDKDVTLFYYYGDIMSSDDFAQLDDSNDEESARKKLSLKSSGGDLVVPRVMTSVVKNKNWMPLVTNRGASIRVGTAENCNVVVMEAMDKSFIVVTTKNIEAGEQLLYPPLEEIPESESDSESDSDSDSSSDSSSEEESDSSSEEESDSSEEESDSSSDSSSDDESEEESGGG
jgi:hypothetical protein